MTRGVDLTLKIVAQSKNQAAVGLLEAAFQSTSETVRKIAGTILATRRTGQGLETIIRNFNPNDRYLVELVNTHRAKLIPGLQGAIVDKDITLARQAFRLAYTQNFYEVLPTLAAFCLGPGSMERNALSMNADLLKFFDRYTDALEKNDPVENRLLYGTLLPEFVKILVQKIKEYRFSRQELTLTVYLRLYPFLSEIGIDRDLYLQLRIPNSLIYGASHRRLLKESDPYLFRFIIRCMERRNPPSIVPQIISERTDITFLEALFKGIKSPLSLEIKANMNALPPLPWIRQIDYILKEIDADAQCGLVLLLQNINVKVDELQICLLKIFEHGKDEGRVAALSALAEFSGDEIDRLVWNASEDSNPTVQIEALTQLNQRDIPGAASRIIQFADSPHEEVRSAINNLLPNFRFSRFMQTFEQLDDERRKRMFNIVRHLDKSTPEELSKILRSGGPIQKAKALLCLDYCREMVPAVEDDLCDILMDSDMPALRCKAAAHLVAGQKDISRTALVQALHRDEKSEVREAAKKSLENRPVFWNASEAN